MKDQTSSLWVGTTRDTAFSSLEGPLDVDVAVVGAGIAGITAAFLLKRAGKSVALIDSKRVVRGATGYTTAKVSVAHGLAYSRVLKNFGEDGARLYAEANQAGFDLISELIETERIECEFERKANYVYAETAGERSLIEAEVRAARVAGLAANLTTAVPLPFPVECAFQLENQAQFHPRKYLLPLASAIDGDGCHVLELTRVLDVEQDDRLRLLTDRGPITAADVILASHLPILDRGLFFAKAHPERSYVVAARIGVDQEPEGMYINVGRPTRSIRTARDEQGPLLLLGGEGHKPGTEPETDTRYGALEEFGRRHWAIDDFPFRWSTQDYMPLAGVPYVGRLTRRSEHIHVATGFQKWGMTNGSVAAIILTDLILGRQNPWAKLYDSKRIKLLASGPRLIKENAAVARHFLLDRLHRGADSPLSMLPAGEGRLTRVGGHKIAAFRDDEGRLHTLSPACTHLGCHVSWNPAERSWDCPCHGSRFSGSGSVINGPATRDLELRRVDQEER